MRTWIEDFRFGWAIASRGARGIFAVGITVSIAIAIWLVAHALIIRAMNINLALLCIASSLLTFVASLDIASYGTAIRRQWSRRGS